MMESNRLVTRQPSAVGELVRTSGTEPIGLIDTAPVVRRIRMRDDDGNPTGEFFNSTEIVVDNTKTERFRSDVVGLVLEIRRYHSNDVWVRVLTPSGFSGWCRSYNLEKVQLNV